MKNLIQIRYPILYLAFICFVLLNTNLVAQTEETNNPKDSVASYLRTEKQLPILNNFKFIPSEVVYDPFINTYIKLDFGSGTALDIKSYRKDWNTGSIRDTLSGDITYISGELQFQLAVNDWLAFNLGAGGSGRLGTNTYTILTSGISYTTFLTLGGKAKIWENDKMVLSTTLDFKYQSIYLYSIYDFIKEVVETGGIDSTTSMLEKDNVSQTFLNVNYAYAPKDWCGILAQAGWGLGEAFETKTRGNVRIGAAFSVDFDNVDFIEFPIGILASVKYSSFGEGGSNVSNIFTYGFKIAYTGHKDFDIGIENTYQSLSYKSSDEKIKTILSAFSLRYYF
jgi:hypothetical protein